MYRNLFKPIIVGMTLAFFSSGMLFLVRRKAMRRGLWFKVLSRTERGVINLTIRCVDEVRSFTLAKVVVNILTKLADAMKSRVETLMETVGRCLAAKLSEFAQGWGYRGAWRWAEDQAFIRYLAVVKMNDSAHFRW